MEEAIQFFQEDTDFVVEHAAELRGWIDSVAQQFEKEILAINYIFCSDEYLHQINLDFLQHDTLTDIITFPYSDEAIESDIYISIERVVENAQTFGVSTQNELRRVMIHGVLHLLGYDDKSPEEQRSMRAKEEECLQRLGE